ncbi:MAG: hypothetical protein Q9227_007232 [Pyrenula ochraceoflavens]
MSGEGDGNNVEALTDNFEDSNGSSTNHDVPIPSQHHSLKHHLLGPSLAKAGQDRVDQKKVADIIYEASKGSKFFNNEEIKDKTLTIKIERILKLKTKLERLDLKHDLRQADEYLASLELSRDLTQYIIHVDCDAFYAMVEELDRPELRDVPMAVGKGVLTTCNYHARKFGCRSGMAGFVAKKLCPQLICLPLNFDKYTAKAKEVRAILAQYDPRFESASIDEAYLNITEYCDNNGVDPEDAVAQMRREVHEKCKITISAGLAANAKIAKIASNKNKPNGQYRIPNDRAAIMSFMNGLPVRKVNGVGRVFERELQAVGIETCGDIYPQRAYLMKLFGEKAFEFLMQTYAGLGRTDVRPAEEHERKSVGTESTFRDMSSKAELREKLWHTAEELEKDLTRTCFKGRTLVLKIKLHTYEVLTRQVAPPKAVCTADELFNYSLPMLSKLEKEIPNMKLRLMGLRVTHLVSTQRGIRQDFFGLHAKAQLSNAGNKKLTDDAGWEIWPEEEFEARALQEREDDMAELERLSQEQMQDSEKEPDPEFHPPFGRYKTPSPRRTKSSLDSTGHDESLWTCPICGKMQPADDRAFNDHVDFCLSRQTIKDAVEGSADVLETTSSSVGEKPASALGKRKYALELSGTPSGNARQKKLFFA